MQVTKSILTSDHSLCVSGQVSVGRASGTSTVRVHARPGLLLHDTEVELVISTAEYDHKLTSIQK